MKVLFAVSNEEISEAIVKRYQKEYKEIISYKNVYYFNAILKEIQKEKGYDRIIISEELESFTNSPQIEVDSFIFDKLDSISDEAVNEKSEDIPVIVIGSDRRSQSDEMIGKLFGIGIYDALIGNDRTVEEVCNLIKKPRIKREAKNYYALEIEDVSYKSINENDVSEDEIQNIIKYYKNLGNDENKYIESFTNIAEQYNATQLRIIGKFLPLNVRVVLEQKSPKYQQIMGFSAQTIKENEKTEEKSAEGTIGTLLKSNSAEKILNKVVIPSNVKLSQTKKLLEEKVEDIDESHIIEEVIVTSKPVEPKIKVKQILEELEEEAEVEITTKSNVVNEKVELKIEKEIVVEEIPLITEELVSGIKTEDEGDISVTPIKRGRGRPRKEKRQEDRPVLINGEKRGRGRPRKEKRQEINEFINLEVPAIPVIDPIEELVLPGIDDGAIELEMDFDLELADVKLPELDNVEPTIEFKSEEVFTAQIPEFGEKEERELQEIWGDRSQEDVTSQELIEEYSKPESRTLYLLSEKNRQEWRLSHKLNCKKLVDEAKVDEDEIQEVVLPLAKEIKDDKTEQEVVIPVAEIKVEEPKIEEPKIVEPQIEQKVTEIISINQEVDENEIDLVSLTSGHKKIVAFVGTSKNGVSFAVNNVASMLANRGVDVAVLDATKNRSAYYVYTNNDERLRKIASKSIVNLKDGIAEGIRIGKNLTVYTSVVEDSNGLENVNMNLETLIKCHEVVLIDCDFETPFGYYNQSEEIYLVQSYDILTIQPFTLLLRNLKEKGILAQNKIRILLNKTVKIKGISDKTIIGGLAFYRDPEMSFMIELFDRNTVKHMSMPFDQDAYTKYLEGIINCDIVSKNYNKGFTQVLTQLSNMVYPIARQQCGTNLPATVSKKKQAAFTSNMNTTLDQMKKF